MTEDETVPAQSPRQAEDAYLAAVSALLVALAVGGRITVEDADVLVDAMPDRDLAAGLRVGFTLYGLHG